MDELAVRLLAIVALIVTIYFDWPRALAGAVVGLAGRWLRRRWLIIPAGVVTVAGAGELIYGLLGRGGSPSWASFTAGLLIAGICALGVFAAIRSILTDD